ncbi:hypothetical protein EYF80_023370 [Liparis tanakae]|uniref:Uncharacterized protein n=1 Tax=Liparis tanakae TaxID=230148 RepID=A0A4Z2HNV5_9TELE|nr:hypothetical protein EYF80_023370 [Liparis tanakae]
MKKSKKFVQPAVGFILTGLRSALLGESRVEPPGASLTALLTGTQHAAATLQGSPAETTPSEEESQNENMPVPAPRGTTMQSKSSGRNDTLGMALQSGIVAAKRPRGMRARERERQEVDWGTVGLNHHQGPQREDGPLCVKAFSSSLPSMLLSVESASSSCFCGSVLGCGSGSVALAGSGSVAPAGSGSVAPAGSVGSVSAVLPSAGLAELFWGPFSPPSRKVDQPFSRSSRSQLGGQLPSSKPAAIERLDARSLTLNSSLMGSRITMPHLVINSANSSGLMSGGRPEEDEACLASASLGYLLLSPFLRACCLGLLGWRRSLQLHLDLDLHPE